MNYIILYKFYVRYYLINRVLITRYYHLHEFLSSQYITHRNIQNKIILKTQHILQIYSFKIAFHCCMFNQY